jgi:hypothetical protein
MAVKSKAVVEQNELEEQALLIPLNCAVSERTVQDADKQAALHKATKKERKPRPTLAVLASRIKRKRDEELPFGRFAKQNKLTMEGEGRQRTIQGEHGHIFLHEHYAYALQYQGTRADVYQAKALVDAGAVLIDTDRLVAYREVRVRDEEVVDDDRVTRVEGWFFDEFKYPIAEGEKNILAEVLKAPLHLTLAFDPTNATQVEGVLKLAKIGKVTRVLSETAKAASIASLEKATMAKKAKKKLASLTDLVPVQESAFEPSYA